jgi:predicted HTH transcriptional regulator
MRESALRKLITVGETSTVELKVASPRPDEMAERLCGLANAQGDLLSLALLMRV